MVTIKAIINCRNDHRFLHIFNIQDNDDNDDGVDNDGREKDCNDRQGKGEGEKEEEEEEENASYFEAAFNRPTIYTINSLPFNVPLGLGQSQIKT